MVLNIIGLFYLLTPIHFFFLPASFCSCWHFKLLGCSLGNEYGVHHQWITSRTLWEVLWIIMYTIILNRGSPSLDSNYKGITNPTWACVIIYLIYRHFFSYYSWINFLVRPNFYEFTSKALCSWWLQHEWL